MLVGSITELSACLCLSAVEAEGNGLFQARQQSDLSSRVLLLTFLISYVMDFIIEQRERSKHLSVG